MSEADYTRLTCDLTLAVAKVFFAEGVTQERVYRQMPAVFRLASE